MSYFGGAQSDGRRTGLNPRLIGALMIAVVGIAMYLFNTEENPVTGEKQRVAMNVDQEMALGLEAAPEMAAQMGGAVDPATDPQARLVEQVGRELIQRSDASRSPYSGNFHFYLLDDSRTINAFALPGGQIFITRALLDKLDNEAQLAGVLGHEIGHVINRHAAEHMATGRLGQLLTVAVGVGASDRDDGGRSAQMVAAMVNQMSQMKFSRSDESESDKYGLRYMADAGYDPSAMLDVMRVLQEASQGNRQPEILATHPQPQTRFDEIEALLAKEYPDGMPATLTKGRSLRRLGSG